MSILPNLVQNVVPASTPGFSRRRGAFATDPVTGQRVDAKVWMNIGYEVNGKFVNLPFGLQIDTMMPAESKGRDPDWLALQAARNNLLKALQAIGDQLEPGTEIEIPNLVIKLRRAEDKTEVKDEDNEYSVDLVALLGAKPANLQPAE